jgi:hypothetical protein
MEIILNEPELRTDSQTLELHQFNILAGNYYNVYTNYYKNTKESKINNRVKNFYYINGVKSMLHFDFISKEYINKYAELKYVIKDPNFIATITVYCEWNSLRKEFLKYTEEILFYKTRTTNTRVSNITNCYKIKYLPPEENANQINYDFIKEYNSFTDCLLINTHTLREKNYDDEFVDCAYEYENSKLIKASISNINNYINENKNSEIIVCYSLVEFLKTKLKNK